LPGWTDRLLGGPPRRRRRLERELRRLDREYAAWASASGAAPRQRADVTSRVALVIALVAAAGVVVAVPELVPRPVRQLLGLGPHRLADAPATSGSGSFTFIAHQPGAGDRPVTYDPCRAILVRVNPDGGPDDAVDLVRDALGEVSRLTGLVLRYDGSTNQRPHWDSEFVPTFLGQLRSQPVLVSWATSSEVPELSGDVAGVGGSVPHQGGDGVVRYVTGGVTLDADTYADLEEHSDGVEEMRAILLHELGHVVGLGHVDDARQLMNGDNVGLLDFGPGDREGLARLGAGSCA
jgi:hypothetical protein